MKTLKTFEQYVTNIESDRKINSYTIVKNLEDSINIKIYEKILLNDLLMIDVVKDNINESKDLIVDLIKGGQFINNPT